MSTFFVVSDIHGFYKEMREALDEAGFDPNNENHWLISCGDNWDRGPNPLEVMKYLRTLPRKILIRANHEDLFEECCDRGEAWGYDYSNGTVQTINELGNAGEGYAFAECCERALARTHVFLDSMVDYFETQSHIFVHAFVPLNNDDGLPKQYIRNRKLSKMDNWREANKRQWEDARWGNPYDLAAQGLLPDKTLVFGHWHTSWPRHEYEGKPETGTQADFSPYYGDGYIGIDACTVHSGKVNVLVIKDEFIGG